MRPPQFIVESIIRSKHPLAYTTAGVVDFPAYVRLGEKVGLVVTGRSLGGAGTRWIQLADTQAQKQLQRGIVPSSTPAPLRDTPPAGRHPRSAFTALVSVLRDLGPGKTNQGIVAQRILSLDPEAYPKVGLLRTSPATSYMAVAEDSGIIRRFRGQGSLDHLWFVSLEEVG